MTTHPDLLISPSALAGLSPVGLRVWNVRDELEGHVVPGVYQHRVYAPTEGDGDLHPLADDPWMLDLADAETRDRVARWVAVRVGLQLSSVAPSWQYGGRLWQIDVPRRGWASTLVSAWWFAPYESPHWREEVTVVPALAEINSERMSELEDGSLLIDALGLAVVARHLGAL